MVQLYCTFIWFICVLHIRIQQKNVLKHKFSTEWHLNNNNNRPSIITIESFIVVFIHRHSLFFFCFSISTHSSKWMKCSQSKSKTFIDDKFALRSKPMSIDFIKVGFVLSKIRHLKCYVLLCNNKQWKLPLQVPIKHSLTSSKIKTKQK